MRRCVWIAAAMAVGVGLCRGQDASRDGYMADGAGSELMQEANPWRISGGFIYKNWLYEHDAMQKRVPESSELSDEWEEGDTDGNGWGFQAAVGRGEGKLNVRFMKSDFDYLLVFPGGRHEIDTIARDFELSWSQIRGHNDQAEWGSTLGFRYLGLQKDVTVTEGAMTVDGSGDTKWLLLLGGYDANWRPFDTPIFQVHGFLHFFLGEADGTARSGSDENWQDGVVSETYGNESSLAYGARASAGLDVALTRRVRVSVDYMREWLYSFDSTDSGIVVFPDNEDALFIENHHAVVASLNYLF